MIFQDIQINRSGAVAQLGARVNGIHEVAGSIPASSTIPSFACSAAFDQLAADRYLSSSNVLDGLFMRYQGKWSPLVSMRLPPPLL